MAVTVSTIPPSLYNSISYGNEFDEAITVASPVLISPQVVPEALISAVKQPSTLTLILIDWLLPPELSCSKKVYEPSLTLVQVNGPLPV